MLARMRLPLEVGDRVKVKDTAFPYQTATELIPYRGCKGVIDEITIGEFPMSEPTKYYHVRIGEKTIKLFRDEIELDLGLSS